MPEQPPQIPGYAQRILDHFMGRPEDAEMRAEYIRRGLVPTNNLSLLIVDDPASEIAPGTGIANPFDYRQKPYGHIIDALRTGQPDLWEHAQEVAAESARISELYWQTASDQGLESPETAGIAAQFEAAGWIKAEVYTQVMHILGPQMEAEGLDPLELCG